MAQGVFGKLKTKLSLLAIAGLTVLSVMLVAPAAANAASNCSTGISTQGAYAYCGTPPGQFRVYILCQNYFTWGSRYVYGPWMNAGGQYPSVVTCAWYEHVYGGIHYQTS